MSQHPAARIVHQWNLDGTYVREWPSLYRLCHVMKIDAANFRTYMRKKLSAYKGFVWTYEKAFPENWAPPVKFIPSGRFPAKEFKKWDFNGVLLETYPSIGKSPYKGKERDINASIRKNFGRYKGFVFTKDSEFPKEEMQRYLRKKYERNHWTPEHWGKELTADEVEEIQASPLTLDELSDFYDIPKLRIARIKNYTGKSSRLQGQKRAVILTRKQKEEIGLSFDSPGMLADRYGVTLEKIMNIQRHYYDKRRGC